MIKVLFICHGNICRSPMAEVIMKHYVKEAGLDACFHIESAATSREEIGNPIYPPAKRVLAAHGMGDKNKRARQMTLNDYREFDYIIPMERYNIRNMQRIIRSDTDGKVHLLMSFAGRDEDIADPWYSGDFEGVFAQISEGCRCLLEKLQGEI